MEAIIGSILEDRIRTLFGDGETFVGQFFNRSTINGFFRDIFEGVECFLVDGRECGLDVGIDIDAREASLHATVKSNNDITNDGMESRK